MEQSLAPDFRGSKSAGRAPAGKRERPSPNFTLRWSRAPRPGTLRSSEKRFENCQPGADPHGRRVPLDGQKSSRRRDPQGVGPGFGPESETRSSTRGSYFDHFAPYPTPPGGYGPFHLAGEIHPELESRLLHRGKTSVRDQNTKFTRMIRTTLQIPDVKLTILDRWSTGTHERSGPPNCLGLGSGSSGAGFGQ